MERLGDHLRITSEELRRHPWAQHGPRIAAVVLDTVILALSAFLAVRFRASLDSLSAANDLASNVTIAVGPMLVLWLISLALAGAYDSHVFGAGTAEVKAVMRASLNAAGLVGIACYLTRFPLSRGFYFVLFTVGLPLLLLTRQVARVGLRALRRRGHLQFNVLLVGAPPQIDEIAGVLRRERWLGFHVVGALVNNPAGISQTEQGTAVLGPTTQTSEVAKGLGVDHVLFVGGAVSSAREMRRAVWELEDTNVQLLLAPSLTDVSADRVRPRPAAGLPLIELDHPGTHVLPQIFKRTFDVAVSAALLLLLSPLLLIVALLVHLEDRGPALFLQERVGKLGRSFGVWKFRTMVPGAEDMLSTVDNRHGADHVLFKSTQDSRITSVGRILRRYSIDELPQLVNVLKGDMSLVGPRPPLPSEVAQYDSDVRRRLRVRPGMTGLWQVSGRSDLSWEDSVRLDLYYVDNWSISQDMLILARTIQAVVSSRGAY